MSTWWLCLLPLVPVIAYAFYVAHGVPDAQLSELYQGYTERRCEGDCGAKLMTLPSTPKPYMCWRCFHDKAYLRKPA